MAPSTQPEIQRVTRCSSRARPGPGRGEWPVSGGTVPSGPRRAALTVTIAVVSALAASRAAGGAGLSGVMLGPDGILYSWSPGGDELRSLSPILAELDNRAVNDLAVSGDGRLELVLIAAPPGSPAGRHPR